MIVVKKYGNRRLYDTESSSYINLEQLAELIRQGQQVQVQDARTGQDLTKEVLLQVLMEVLHGGDLFPTALLHRIIRATGDSPWSRMTYQQLSAGLQLLSSQLDQAERLMSPAGVGLPNPFAAWTGPQPGRASAPPPAAPRPPREPEPEPEPEPESENEPEAEASQPGLTETARAQLDELRARLADLERLLEV